jgi:hypothetical protein
VEIITAASESDTLAATAAQIHLEWSRALTQLNKRYGLRCREARV